MNLGSGTTTVAVLLFLFDVHVVLAVNQDTINYMSENLEIYYDVINNLADTYNSYKAEIILKNKGNEPITDGDWAIYFSHIRIIEPKHFPFKVPTKNNSYVIPKTGIAFQHVNGALYKLSPVRSFADITSGSELKIAFTGQYWTVARTDIMPNWYVTADGCVPKIIKNTADQGLKFVGKFHTKEKWKRYWTKDLKDLYNPYSPQERYDKIHVKDLGRVGKLVIPTPLRITVVDKSLDLADGQWLIDVGQGLNEEAKFLSAALGINISTGVTPSSRVISLKIDSSLNIEMQGETVTSQEAYTLKIDSSAKKVNIKGLGKVGVFYGVQTLLSLNAGTDDSTLPEVTIEDAPRYSYRGMMVDVCRNFQSKDAIKKIIDSMAMYKLNKFHFHLSDDEGWRLQIPGLDELTTVGSKRCFDLDEKTCILSQLGSGPRTDTSGSGFYNVSDYKEILEYAKERHIQVIPEFDMPGHGHAAIKAMEARYYKLKGQGDTSGAEKYLLSELGDPSAYLSIQYFYDNAINPCLDSTYTFIDHVIKEVKKMHKDIQPLTTFHFGGDEVAHGAWINSSKCSQVIAKLQPGEDLKQYFVYKVSEKVANNGLNISAWEDGLVNHTVTGAAETPYDIEGIKTQEAVGYAWQNVWEWGVANRAYKLANAGYKVVMSQATHLYFDHPEEPDPEEQGYYWAPRFTDTRKTFGFMPDSLYENADFKRSGEVISKDWLCKVNKLCVTLEKTENILGIQGQLWSETVRTDEGLFHMVYPRLLALAERAWHKAEWENLNQKSARDEDWRDFANTLGYKELARLDKLGITYRVPPPGYKDSVLACSFPGLIIEYSTDDGKTWKKGKEKLPESVTHISILSADNKRRSRLIELHIKRSAATRLGILGPVLGTLLFFTYLSNLM